MQREPETIPVPQPPKAKPRCRSCHQEIADAAKVCHLCGRPQNPVLNFFRYSDLISIGILIISIWQLTQALQQRVDASEAYAKAESALVKAVAAESRILEARRDVLEISAAVIDIADMIPNVTGFGAGTGDEDRAKLKKISESLKLRIRELKK